MNNVSGSSWILSIQNCTHFIKFEGKLTEVGLYISREADFAIHSSQPCSLFTGVKQWSLKQDASYFLCLGYICLKTEFSP